MAEKLITNLINLGAIITSEPNKDKAIDLLKSFGIYSVQAEHPIEMLCDKYKQENTLTCKYFYWKPLEGKKIYLKLKEAAVDATLDEETRLVASSLLHDGSPSAMGYGLKMNAYYMEHFIKIVSGAS